MRTAPIALAGFVAAAIVITVTVVRSGESDEQSEPGAALAAALALPWPGGDYGTGTTRLHLVDQARPDPWGPDEHRELMVALWYPADADGPSAPYMTEAEAVLFVEDEPDIDPRQPAGVATNSVLDVTPHPEAGALPLVLLSPGLGMPAATLTGLAEELASHGYAAVVLGHAHEGPVGFPDRTTDCLVCERPSGEALAQVRAADLSFVLDAFNGEDAAWEHASRIDSERVVVGGHSIGGAAAILALVDDARFAAAFNLDGTLFALDGRAIDRPIMLLGLPTPDRTWTKVWKSANGLKEWIDIDGAEHLSFTDLAVLSDQLGRPLQELDGERCDAMVRSHVVAFVERALR
jgi:predicted dienelactone hydrolase